MSWKAALLALWLPAPAAAQAPGVFSMTLSQAERLAQAHSLELRAASEQAAAAGDAARAQFAALLPRLTLGGSYSYQTNVPTISVFPGSPAVQFGSHRSYSVGPSLGWTLWDEGALYKTWRAQQAEAGSQDEQRELTRLEATLGARLAYVQVQLAREQVLLLSNSVSLAAAQYRDIKNRYEAGAASKIDALSSHQELLSRRKDFLGAQAQLGTSLSALLQLTGQGAGLDVSRPVDIRLSSGTPAGLPGPTLLVELDPLAGPPPALAGADATSVPATHPEILLYQRQADASRLTSQALSNSEWPRIQLSAQTAYEYPNYVLLQSVTQNIVGLSASVPLFEGRQTAREVSQQKHLAEAAERRRDLAAEQLDRDWESARAALASQRSQLEGDELHEEESAELARLVYASYLAGRSNYIDVQTYNLTALLAKVQAAQTRAQILIELATLAELAGQG